MIQFSKLRINGFKSFVDRTELEIGPGLNGIVGPNGCGKSNLVEAVRWVMGDNSPKRMRGEGMEDVIFNGTEKRSPRNIAEVALLLDNSTRSAPAAYNSTNEIEVIRRIERDHGSSYKINGKNVRMRDVQMLFADTVTGANSPSIVSQGKVTQIINSKPLERRLILEESAGISGLFARRHEAELRLRAADANLLRIEDVLGSMEARLGNLKRQARQATRYRNINAQIRQLELLVAWLEWKNLAARMETTRQKFAEAETAVAEKLATVTQLTKTQTTQAADLPALRQAETEAAAALQTKKIALQRLEDETNRLEEALKQAQEQLEQSIVDQNHENQNASEGAQLLEKLELEQKNLIEAQESDSGDLEEKQRVKETLESKVAALEEQYTALMQSAAESKARRQALEQQIEQNRARIDVVQARKAKAAEDLQALEESREHDDRSEEFNNLISKLEKNLEVETEELSRAVTALKENNEALNVKRSALKTAEVAQNTLETEIGMLESLLKDSDGSYSSVMDDLTADKGFEKALSRALGDALLASLDEKAPTFWFARRARPDLPGLPGGLKSLTAYVKAPKELDLALSQIGLVENRAQGDELAQQLKPGQSLVCEDGTFWRWDGFSKKAEANDSNAMRLEQKNRLQDLLAKRPEAQASIDTAQTALDKALALQQELDEQNTQLQASTKELQSQITEQKLEQSRLREEIARFESEKARLNETLRLAEEDLQTLQEVIRWDQDRLKVYEKDASEQKEEDSDKLRQTLIEAREAYQTAIRAFDIHQQEQNSRKARLHAIADERINLQNRMIRAKERLKSLEERQESSKAKIAELENQPQTSGKEQEALLSIISELEQARTGAAEKLAACEFEVSETGRALKEAESTLGESREARAHAQATVSALQDQQTEMERAIREQFDMAPHDLPEHAAVDMEKFTEDLESLRNRKDKFIRERESIGPVNLRADDEAQELEKEVTKILHERNDLMQAIEELRGGISKINKEARERLISAFDHVNAHFQTLFTRLYGGGRAHLALIDSEDPLGAGLEIFAQPPGKTLQSLSLLSGGEQTLASIALIFAMFLTNPSPICVLDEIDAPLDDANVDRVCNLLEEIAERGETRFLIITHHRMTMARMDRLYGVTMAEKGVSQLVSVDLQQSFDFLQAA